MSKTILIHVVLEKWAYDIHIGTLELTTTPCLNVCSLFPSSHKDVIFLFVILLLQSMCVKLIYSKCL
jgi:hypothetical protein